MIRIKRARELWEVQGVLNGMVGVDLTEKGGLESLKGRDEDVGWQLEQRP